LVPGLYISHVGQASFKQTNELVSVDQLAKKTTCR
jgi:hypothetical protein